MLAPSIFLFPITPNVPEFDKRNHPNVLAKRLTVALIQQCD